jgi:hypothetical protein
MFSINQSTNQEITDNWIVLKSHLKRELQPEERENVGEALLHIVDGPERKHHTKRDNISDIVSSLNSICPLGELDKRQDAEWTISFLSRLLSPQTLEYSLVGWTSDAQSSSVLEMVSRGHDSFELNDHVQETLLQSTSRGLSDATDGWMANLAQTLIDMQVKHSLLTKVIDKINQTKNFAHKIPNLPSTQIKRWMSDPVSFDDAFLDVIKDQLDLIGPSAWTNLPYPMSHALAIPFFARITQTEKYQLAIRAMDLLLRCIQQNVENAPLQQLFQSLQHSSQATGAFWNMKLGIPLDKQLPLEVISRLSNQLPTFEREQLYCVMRNIYGRSTVLSD